MAESELPQHVNYQSWFAAAQIAAAMIVDAEAMEVKHYATMFLQGLTCATCVMLPPSNSASLIYTSNIWYVFEALHDRELEKIAHNMFVISNKKY